MEKKSDITPIFVLGSGRSGTTWLCNELSCHPNIAGAQHIAHWGSDESVIYRTHFYVGDLSDDRRFIEFHEAYSSSDYFRLCQGDKEYFYRNREKFNHFYDYFLELMDQFAEKTNCRYWITKLDPHFYYYPNELEDFMKRVQARYADCKFIGIQRQFKGVLKSVLNSESSNSIHKRSLFVRVLVSILHAARHVVHKRGIEQQLREHPSLPIVFEDMVKDRQGHLEKIGQYLDLDFSPGTYTMPYPRNSSFADKSRKRRDPKLAVWFSCTFLEPFFRLVPITALWFMKGREKLRGNPCPWYWRLLRLEKMPEAYNKWLLESGETALRKLIFEEATPEQLEPVRLRKLDKAS